MTTPPPPTDTVILPQPQLIGTHTVAAALGVKPKWLRRLIQNGDRRVTPGYLGKIADRHTWNAHELFASMYSSTMALTEEIARVEAGIKSDRWCSVPDCENDVQFLDLCRRHILQLRKVFADAERSGQAVWRLLAMCTWVVERNRHMRPPEGWDPWSGICMTPGCQNDTDRPAGRSSPLCPSCSAKFWSQE